MFPYQEELENVNIVQGKKLLANGLIWKCQQAPEEHNFMYLQNPTYYLDEVQGFYPPAVQQVEPSNDLSRPHAQILATAQYPGGNFNTFTCI